MKQITKITNGHKQGFPLLMVALTIFGTLLLVFLIRGYTARFQETFSSETQAYMLEIATQVNIVINDRVDANIKNMETTAVAMAKMDLTDPAETAGVLNEEAKRYGYTRLLLAGTDGIALGNQGNTYNVSTKKHYLAALKGKSTVSDVVTSDYNNSDSIEFAVPVKAGNSVAGVLVAGYNLSDFADILQVHMFGGNGSALVIDGDGVVIVNNGKEPVYNFYYYLKDSSLIAPQALAQLEADISKGVTGVLNYTYGQAGYMVHYQPLGINDWFLLISAPTDSITQKTNLFLMGMTYIGIAIGAIVAFLLLMVVFIQYRNRKTLEALLYVDPITGGFSQAKFEEEAKIRIAKEAPGTYAMVQMNIERFKLINTTFGRQTGDRLLRHVYQTMYAQLEANEIVGRFNADRFCMLLQYHTQEALAIRLSDLCNRINQFNDSLKTKYILHFNEGICLIDDAHTDISILYERANFARTHGGNLGTKTRNIGFYDELERSSILREKEIENRMADALAHGEFEVYLQPKYELKQNKVAGAEALVRWNDPERGMIFPNDFIPLFEQNGFIVEVDLYMFQQVCRLLQQWHDQGQSSLPISVNLSRVHLSNPNFLNRYREIYSQHTFPPQLIEIELTESAVFDNMELLCKVIDEIHAVGFECAMDDFGSGYSSLNLLKDIPVDTLKLDRAFFYSRTGDHTKSRYVIENVINLAEKLSMKTVSEGVETLEQVEHLRGASCQMVQGYVFAKPMPISEFEQLLKRGMVL